MLRPMGIFTSAANTENVHLVLEGRKIIFQAQCILKVLKLFVVYLYGSSALYANQMVVVSMPELMLEPAASVSEVHFSGDPGVADELQCPVYGAVSDPRMDPGQNPVEFLRGNVILSVEKYLKDLISLIGFLQVSLSEVTVEKLLFCSHGATLNDYELHVQLVV